MAPSKPAARPRGRPRKTLDLDQSVGDTGSSPASSRPSITSKGSVRVPATSKSKSSPYFSKQIPDNENDDDSTSDLPSPSMLPQYSSAKKTEDKKPVSRASLSSVATSNDSNEASDYSTPATSGFATPALPQSKSTGRMRRTRTQSAMSTIIQRPEKVSGGGESEYSGLYSRASLQTKRKRDEDDEEDDYEDNSADARLARKLQEEEDMFKMAIEPAPRRTPRKANIMGRAGNDSNLPLKVLDDKMTGPVSKRPKIELSSVSNAVSFGLKKKNVISDSESDFAEIDDSDDTYAALVSKHPNFGCPRPRGSKQRFGVSMPNNSISREARKTKVKEAFEAMEAAASTSTSLGSIVLDSENDNDTSSALSLYDSDDSDDLPLRDVQSRRMRNRASMQFVAPERGMTRRSRLERARLESHHPEINTMWKDLENLPKVGKVKMEQPKNINRELKPFQLEGLSWMRAMEETEWGGGLLGDEMGMGKTIQAVSLIMSDFPAAQPSLVLIPPVALMQWQQEIADYTDGTLKTFVFHGTNAKTKGLALKELKQFDVILMSYNSLESMFRRQEKGFSRKGKNHKEKSLIHQIHFHRVILDEAHNIKQRTSGSAKACFALKADHKWCLSGTPLQNRIGEFFSLVRFLDIRPFACYFCKQCPCSKLEWQMNEENRCEGCNHSGMQHVSVFNQELLNPIQKFGNKGPGKEAFRKLRILTDRFMLRRVKRDHSSSMELPSKEIYVDRHFFGEEENDFAGSIMNNGMRKFETYVAQGVLLNNYANIFGLIMQMRQVADHPDLILKKNGEGGQNILVCCICDETAEEAVRSACRHDFCRDCAKNYLKSSESPDCPQCHIPLAIDLEQPEIEQDENQVKKSSIINRIKMENWTSSSKIEALVHDLYQLRSKNMSTKSIIFSQFTTMLQLVEWRLRRAGITTVMLDGSMTPAQRQASINHFMTDVDVECFLVSLKAGGVALNLTEASHVFIVDPWWNPAAEWQSADRCHRIGQARPCSITRLCIEDSVESRMVLLQEKKANMINSTINADEAAMESLTPEDMQFLFRGN